ncbi:phosphoglycolate phosphatase [Psychrobacter aquimaris]|uniref:phosphoglycolate phosphatase n=1 Tax=Psychrobacter aquimaris TaxID=292733 RepID=UPI003FD39ACE
MNKKEMNNNDKQLLIFDFDGTLIDSVPDLADATNAMLTTLGKETYSIDTIRNWIGNGSRLLVERALVGDIAVPEDAQTQAEADHAEQIFFEAYTKIGGSKTVAYPDVDSGLRKLHTAGYTLALVTNKPIRFVPKILESFGWQDLFSEVMGGDSLPVKKPDPAPLLHVCATLNVSVAQSVMIGDSRNDILAGQNANMDTLGLSYGYNYGQDIRELNPTEAFDSFADLVAWIMKDNA